MEYLAIAIAFAVVLNLIDRNRKWKEFGVILKWVALFVGGAIVWEWSSLFFAPDTAKVVHIMLWIGVIIWELVNWVEKKRAIH